MFKQQIWHYIRELKQVKPQSSTRAFPVCGKEQNHAKKGNIRLSVAIRGSQMSVLKLPIFSVWLTLKITALKIVVSI